MEGLDPPPHVVSPPSLSAPDPAPRSRRVGGGESPHGAAVQRRMRGGAAAQAPRGGASVCAARRSVALLTLIERPEASAFLQLIEHSLQLIAYLLRLIVAIEGPIAAHCARTAEGCSKGVERLLIQSVTRNLQ